MVKIRNGKVSLFHIKFKLLCVSSTLGLEVTNTPGTSNFLSSNLTGSVFFSNRMYSVSKNVSFLFFPLCFGRLRCHFIELFFFAETNWHFSCFYCFELLLLLLILIILSCLNCFFSLNKLHSDQLVLFKIDWHSDLTLSRFKKN